MDNFIHSILIWSPQTIKGLLVLQLDYLLHCVQPPLSPVTCYNISCTSTDGDGSCSELLPANTTSFTLSVDAGVQYTFMVSALVDDRESQNSPTVDFGKILVC